jgi:hypothetical protein
MTGVSSSPHEFCRWMREKKGKGPGVHVRDEQRVRVLQLPGERVDVVAVPRDEVALGLLEGVARRVVVPVHVVVAESFIDIS